MKKYLLILLILSIVISIAMLLVNGITGDAIEESVKKKVDEEKLRMFGGGYGYMHTYGRVPPLSFFL